MKELSDELQACAGGLTVQDPWAQAIIHGPKRIENRTWKPPEKVIGERIAVDCGKTLDQSIAEPGVEWGDDGYLIGAGELTGRVGLGAPYDAHKRHHHPGHIIGTVRVVGWVGNIRRTDEGNLTSDGRLEKPLGCWEHLDVIFPQLNATHDVVNNDWWQDSTDYGWLLDDPQPLDEPIPARGMPGIWDVARQVEEVQS